MHVVRRSAFLSLLVMLLPALLPGSAPALPGFSVSHFGGPAPFAYEFFGQAITSLGDELVIGAPGHAAFPAGLVGRVYVLDVFGTVSRVIENPTPNVGDGFGTAVAIVGANVLVGAPFDDTVAPDAGAAYLHDGATGALLRTFVVPGSGTNWQCARAVAALGANVLVGCDGAYLFDASSGALIRHFTGPGSYTRGDPIATLDGDVLLSGYAASGTVQAVHRYHGTTGDIVQTYVDPSPGSTGVFGGSIAAAGGEVFIGRGWPSYPEERAYLFDATTGSLLHTFASPLTQPPYNDGFGHSVALAGSDRVVGGWNGTDLFAADTNAFLGRERVDNPSNESLRSRVSTVLGDSFVAFGGDDLGPSGSGSIYLFDRCGNGTLSGGEECDDGNTLDGDGCASDCDLELCPPTPGASACRSLPPGGTSILKLVKRKQGQWGVNADTLSWTWRGEATDLAEFGVPGSDTSFQLCVYDNFFFSPTLRMAVGVPAAQACAGEPCWELDGDTYHYRDPAGSPSGVTRMDLRAGVDRRASIIVKGSGEGLGVPGPLLPSGQLPVTFGIGIVLRNTSNGECWAAATGDIKNANGRLRARAGG